MSNETEIGMNRTGLGMAPRLSDEMMENINVQPTTGDGSAMVMMRGEYIENAEPVGSVPPPSTLKDAAKAGLEMLKGHHPEVLVDKLGERLAFERTGVRLYDALIQKCEKLSPEADIPPIELLRQFREEEAQHLEIVQAALRRLGADPTTMTPCADTIAVSSMGIMQVITEPRTTVAQSLQAILTAELTDNEGWQLLIQLAEVLGLSDVVDSFQGALEAEDRHLSHIRIWLSELVINEAMVI